jgi:voltage-gated potassium channel Kch
MADLEPGVVASSQSEPSIERVGRRMALNRVQLLIGLLLANILLGIVVVRNGLGLSYLDATYFVITIVTTIGFGDFNLAESPTLIKVYGIYLMISGAGGYALGFSLIVDALVKSRLLEITGRKGYRMKNHVILCGFGRLGPKILENLLKLGDEVLVIDRGDREESLERLRNRKIPYLVGDMRQQETLEKASIRTCKSIVLGTDNDLANLEAALMAKEIAPNVRIIVRMYDPNLAERVEKGFGIQSVLSSSTVGAPFFAQAAHSEELIDTTPIDEEIFVTYELTVSPKSNIKGMTIGQFTNSMKLAVLVLKRRSPHHQGMPDSSVRGDRTEFPSTDTVLQEGDRLTISVNANGLQKIKDINR